MATDKFKALVHHVVSSCDDPAKLGAVRLNKILWFADTIAYRLHGVPITGERYVKRQHGPVPKTILRTLAELEADGAIMIREKPTALGFPMRLYISLENPTDEVFSAQERAIIDSLADEICNRHTANSISDVSHDQVWDAANMGEEIPFSATLARDAGEITEEVQTWGSAVVERVMAAR